MSAAKPYPVPLTLRGLASEALVATDGEAKSAIDALVKRLNEDKALLKNIVADAVFDAVSMRVQAAVRSTRDIVVSAAIRADKSGVIALANGLSASLLDFPLANGLRLRDATAEQVSEQIGRYESMSNDMAHKARWLRLVIQGVPRDKRVGDVMTPARAKELWEESANA